MMQGRGTQSPAPLFSSSRSHVIASSEIRILNFSRPGRVWMAATLLTVLLGATMTLYGDQDGLERYRRIEDRTFDWAVAPGLGDPSEALRTRVEKALEELRI